MVFWRVLGSRQLAACRSAARRSGSDASSLRWIRAARSRSRHLGNRQPATDNPKTRPDQLHLRRRRHRLRRRLEGGRMSERVLIVIPAFNAERTIGAVIRECREVLDDVLVVDDGSIDRTAAEALEAGARVISHSANRGKGAALKTGFGYAMQRAYDAVITLDADGQHLPREIPKFLIARAETKADLIIG